MAQSIETMDQRYQMLINRKGKNSENVGIMRKLRRKINKAKQGVILSQLIYLICVTRIQLLLEDNFYFKDAVRRTYSLNSIFPHIFLDFWYILLYNIYKPRERRSYEEIRYLP